VVRWITDFGLPGPDRGHGGRYLATVITPAMCMHLTGIGSQYLLATRDSDGKNLDGAKS
jgi:hypothetical protein